MDFVQVMECFVGKNVYIIPAYLDVLNLYGKKTFN